MRVLAIEPLTTEAFAPFGRVIGFDPARARRVNEDTAERADTDAVLVHHPEAAPVLALYRAQAQSLPVRATLFERHPHSAQSFVSLSCARFLVVVAPAGRDGLPDVAAARAFEGRLGTGISYRPDQWHMPILSIAGDGDLLMLMGERGTAEDCVEHRLPAPILLHHPDGSSPENRDHDA